MLENRSVTRRDFLQAGALMTGAAATLSTLPALDAAEPALPWIDAHSHIWPATADRFPLAAGQTVKDLNPPSFTDDELMALARPEGVGRAVLIQHSIYHMFDNSYLIDAVRRHPQRFRIVGMIDDHQPGVAETMKTMLTQGVTGFRITPFIRKEQPEKWLDTPGMLEMWETAARTRQAMSCLINAEHLEGVERMCGRFPETPVVIDHFARIGVDSQFRDDELAKLIRLARHPHTHVKISAFYALGRKQPPHTELIPVIRKLVEAFGARRLMWASDAPYQVQGVNTYRDSIRLIRETLDFVSAEDRRALLAGTVERVYFFR